MFLGGRVLRQESVCAIYVAKFMDNAKLGGIANARCLCVLDARQINFFLDMTSFC